MATDPTPLSCRLGHEGPWRYIEEIEVWRTVDVERDGSITITSGRHLPPEEDDFLGDTPYLMCWHEETTGRQPGRHCGLPVEVSEHLTIHWP